MSCCNPKATNRSREGQGKEETNTQHRVDMLPLNQVAALMSEAREENLALSMQLRGSRPELRPSAPEDRSNKIHVVETTNSKQSKVLFLFK